MKRRIRDTHEFPYVYKLYDTGGTKRIFQMEIGADSPKEAVKKAINYLCDSEGGAFRKGAVNSDTVKNALWEMTEGYGEK